MLSNNKKRTSCAFPHEILVERFSTLVTRLQSQQIAGIQSLLYKNNILDYRQLAKQPTTEGGTRSARQLIATSDKVIRDQPPKKDTETS